MKLFLRNGVKRAAKWAINNPEAAGAYTNEARPVLYCVVTRSEVQQLKTIVHEADPQAFMVIGVAHEGLGEGFQPFKKQGV
jgi:uncharacterized membrane-anchored protein YitT (DUF2179 family)